MQAKVKTTKTGGSTQPAPKKNTTSSLAHEHRFRAFVPDIKESDFPMAPGELQGWSDLSALRAQRSLATVGGPEGDRSFEFDSIESYSAQSPIRSVASSTDVEMPYEARLYGGASSSGPVTEPRPPSDQAIDLGVVSRPHPTFHPRQFPRSWFCSSYALGVYTSAHDDLEISPGVDGVLITFDWHVVERAREVVENAGIKPGRYASTFSYFGNEKKKRTVYKARPVKYTVIDTGDSAEALAFTKHLNIVAECEQLFQELRSWEKGLGKMCEITVVDPTKVGPTGRCALTDKKNKDGKVVRKIFYVTPAIMDSIANEQDRVSKIIDELQLYISAVELMYKGYLLYHSDKINRIIDAVARAAREQEAFSRTQIVRTSKSAYKARNLRIPEIDRTLTDKYSSKRTLSHTKVLAGLLNMTNEKQHAAFDVRDYVLGQLVPTAIEIKAAKQITADPWLLPVRVRCLHRPTTTLWSRLTTGTWLAHAHFPEYPLRRVDGDEERMIVWNYWSLVALFFWDDYCRFLAILAQNRWGSHTLAAFAIPVNKGKDPLVDIWYQVNLQRKAAKIPMSSAIINQPFQNPKTMGLSSFAQSIAVCHTFTNAVLKAKATKTRFIPKTGQFAAMGFVQTTVVGSSPRNLGEWQLRMDQNLVTPKSISLFMSPSLDVSEDRWPDLTRSGIDPPVIIDLPDGVVGTVPKHTAACVRAIYGLKVGKIRTVGRITSVNLAPAGPGGSSRTSFPKKKKSATTTTTTTTVKRTVPKKKNTRAVVHKKKPMRVTRVVVPKKMPKPVASKPMSSSCSSSSSSPAPSLVPFSRPYWQGKQEFLFGTLSAPEVQTAGTILGVYEVNLSSVLSMAVAMGQDDDLPFVAMSKTATMYQPQHVSFHFQPMMGNVSTGRIAAIWMPPTASLTSEEDVVNQIELYRKTPSLKDYVTIWDWTYSATRAAKRHVYNSPLPVGIRPISLTVEQASTTGCGRVYFVLLTPLSSTNLAPTGASASTIPVVGVIGQVWVNYSMALYNPAVHSQPAVERIHTRTNGVSIATTAVTGTDAPQGRVLQMSIPSGPVAPNVVPNGSGSVLISLSDGTIMEIFTTLGSNLLTSVVSALPVMISSAIGPFGEIFGFMAKLWGTLGTALEKSKVEEQRLQVTNQGIPAVDALSTSVENDQYIGSRSVLLFNSASAAYFSLLGAAPDGSVSKDWWNIIVQLKTAGFYPQLYFGTRGITPKWTGADVEMDYYMNDTIPPTFSVSSSNIPVTDAEVLPITSGTISLPRVNSRAGFTATNAHHYAIWNNGCWLPVVQVPDVGSDFGHSWILETWPETVVADHNSVGTFMANHGLLPIYGSGSQVDYRGNFRFCKVEAVSFTFGDAEFFPINPIGADIASGTFADEMAFDITWRIADPIIIGGPDANFGFDNSDIVSKWRWTDTTCTYRPVSNVDTSDTSTAVHVYVMIPA